MTLWRARLRQALRLGSHDVAAQPAGAAGLADRVARPGHGCLAKRLNRLLAHSGPEDAAAVRAGEAVGTCLLAAWRAQQPARGDVRVVTAGEDDQPSHRQHVEESRGHDREMMGPLHSCGAPRNNIPSLRSRAPRVGKPNRAGSWSPRKGGRCDGSSPRRGCRLAGRHALGNTLGSRRRAFPPRPDRCTRRPFASRRRAPAAGKADSSAGSPDMPPGRRPSEDRRGRTATRKPCDSMTTYAGCRPTEDSRRRSYRSRNNGSSRCRSLPCRRCLADSRRTGRSRQVGSANRCGRRDRSRYSRRKRRRPDRLRSISGRNRSRSDRPDRTHCCQAGTGGLGPASRTHQAGRPSSAAPSPGSHPSSDGHTHSHRGTRSRRDIACLTVHNAGSRRRSPAGNRPPRARRPPQ